MDPMIYTMTIMISIIFHHIPLYPHSHSGVLEKQSKKTIPAAEIDGNLSYAVAPVLRVVVARQRASTANNSPTLDTNLLWCCEICNL
jgi:hypothetical protein